MSQNWAGLFGFLLEGTGTGNCAVVGYARVTGYSVNLLGYIGCSPEEDSHVSFLVSLRFELLMHVRWSSGFL